MPCVQLRIRAVNLFGKSSWKHTQFDASSQEPERWQFDPEQLAMEVTSVSTKPKSGAEMRWHPTQMLSDEGIQLCARITAAVPQEQWTSLQIKCNVEVLLVFEGHSPIAVSVGCEQDLLQFKCSKNSPDTCIAKLNFQLKAHKTEAADRKWWDQLVRALRIWWLTG